MSEITRGVLRMPPELWGDDPLSVAQRHARYVQAADTIDRLQAECDALRAELQSVLDDWNALVKASGLPTNGGAIGHVRALQAECDALRAELLSIGDLDKRHAIVRKFDLSEWADWAQNRARYAVREAGK